MSLQSTPNHRNSQQPFRALALLVLMLCLLISCPLKRELKSVLTQDVPAKLPAPAAQQARQAIASITPANLELACVKTVHSILDEVETSSLFQHFDFERPLIFLALSLAALYLVVVDGTGTIRLSHAFFGGALTAKIPLFLRHRQLVI